MNFKFSKESLQVEQTWNVSVAVCQGQQQASETGIGRCWTWEHATDVTLLYQTKKTYQMNKHINAENVPLQV